MKNFVVALAEERKLRLEPTLEERLKLFCKNVALMKQVQVIEMRNIDKEISKPLWDESVMTAFWGDDMSGAKWLLCMRAFECLRAENTQFGDEG